MVCLTLCEVHVYIPFDIYNTILCGHIVKRFVYQIYKSCYIYCKIFMPHLIDFHIHTCIVCTVYSIIYIFSCIYLFLLKKPLFYQLIN